MTNEPVNRSPATGRAPAARRELGAGVNVFRDAWEYRITAAGIERLAARTGASPAFLGILAIVSAASVTFGHIALATPHIDGDDLELFLSTMCEMGLLAPVEEDAASTDRHPGDGLPQARSQADAGDIPATDSALPVALLVHAEARVRANWRRLLAGRGFELLEGSELAGVERLIRERRPAWVVLGLHGEDFDGLHLLRALKRPRAPRFSRVCLVLPRGRVLEAEAAETAARADATVNSGSDIVRALCGAEAIDEPAAAVPAVPAVLAVPRPEAQAAPPSASSGTQPVSAPEPPAPAPPASAPPAPAPGTSSAATVAAACKPATPPANPPVWMSLLYGDAFKYGSYESEHACDLEAHYPRLMVRMIEGWSDPRFAAEINHLIVDERGGRQGFPPEVMDELWFLHQVHQTIHAQSETTSRPPAWHVYPADALLQPDGISGKSAALH